MKLGAATPLVVCVGLCAVHGFNIGGPVRVSSRQTGMQRNRWLSMVEKAAPPAAAKAAAAARKRSIEIQFVQETPGGYITVVEITNPKGITQHRIVVGKEQVEMYSKEAGKDVEVKDLVMYVAKYMMDKGMSMANTEGMIDSSVFPVNYFTLKQKAMLVGTQCWLHTVGSFMGMLTVSSSLSYYHDDVDEKIIQLCKDAPDLSEL